MTEVARRFGVSRQTVHAWLRRYAADGGAVVWVISPRGRIRVRIRCPGGRGAVLELRGAHPAWGADRIRYQLEREGVGPVPGRTSIYRALVRHGLVSRRSGVGSGRIIGGGNGAGRWSCGRWMWSAGSTWSTGPS